MIDIHLDAGDKKNTRANNPFVWQSLFDELTSSPLCARAVPFSKQLPLITHRWQKNSSPHRCAWCHLHNFYSTLRTTLHTCSKTIPPPQSKSAVPKSRLPRLKYIGIMHRGLIKSSHCRVPWDWSALCDMAVKTLTDCLTNKLCCVHVRAHTRTHTQPQACKHTCAHKITGTDCFINSTLTPSPGCSSSYYFKTLCLLFWRF